MTYDGHRAHPRRRLAPHQARRAPERADLDDQVDFDASTPEPPPLPEPSAPTTAAEFAVVLALALHGVPLAEHTPAQLDRLRVVLAVAAPGITLTDPDPQEPPVPTAPTPAPVVEDAPTEPEDGQRPSSNLDEGPATEPEPEVDHGQGSELAALLTELVAERAETAVVLAERDALLAEAADPQRIAAAEVAAIAAARQHAEDEDAITDLRARVDAAQHLTAVATAHLIVSVAGIALASHGLPSTEAHALALTTTVPTDALVVATGGRVDVEAARTVLAAAAARAAAGGVR